MTGTLASALDARGIKASENLKTEVQGDVEDVDGVLKISKIRLNYSFKAPKELHDKAQRALAAYAALCPAYQSVKDCIECTWEADIEEE